MPSVDPVLFDGFPAYPHPLSVRDSLLKMQKSGGYFNRDSKTGGV
ncbi:MAG TPA: hypothetical protein VEY51_07910 [Chondromyces sp.]|nr:hypothetical protein [Chondromyces sp.]